MYFVWKSERFVGACRRGYRGTFWHVFVRGKCTPGRGSRSVKRLFIDRLGVDVE